MENKRHSKPEQQYLNLFSVVRQDTPVDKAKPSNSIVIQIRLKDAAKDRSRPVLYKKDSEFWISNPQ